MNKKLVLSENMQKNLNDLRQIVFREKYRFDQGNAFLVFVNFALLVVTLAKQNGNPNMTTLYVSLGLLGTWLLGYILDKIVKVQDAQEKIVLMRSPIWQENFQRHSDHNSKLEQLILKLEQLEKKIDRQTNS